ncbi:MAG TPA: iron-containing redox enzyme family protein [Solirubrobacteraceae bacterium]|nr:iron-containing redox enzyme family protein [Solirubrobacteraceae bacterium]
MDLIAELDAAGRRWDVLRHPFYVSWSAGELTRADLAFYAGEYRHAVLALAGASGSAAAMATPERRAELAAHAAEESSHVALWDAFAGALDADLDREPLANTRRCVETWTAGDDLLDHLAVLYSIESAQPAISATKLRGLSEHYGMVDAGAATAYFELHSERDLEHARQAREAIVELTPAGAEQRLLDRAEEALKGNWLLLDDVHAHTG